MNVLTIVMALLMGFTGSLHCAGMCGPIVWVMPFQFFNGTKKWLGIFLYHFGRITTYALLSLVLHSFRNFFHPQIQQCVSIIIGALLLFVGILSFSPNHTFKLYLPWSSYIKTQLSVFITKPGVSTLFVAGLLNGLLPCGLVYMALSASVSVSNICQAMGFMYVFGAGTLPMLVSITLLKRRAAFFRFQNIKKWVPVTVFAFGCLFILRGMNLGISYLSPKVEVTQHKIKASCCHKN